jgi:hypothetical protein
MSNQPSGPNKRSDEPPVRETTDVEREASGTDTTVAPGEERQPDSTWQRRDDEPDDDIE